MKLRRRRIKMEERKVKGRKGKRKEREKCRRRKRKEGGRHARKEGGEGRRRDNYTEMNAWWMQTMICDMEM